MHTAHSTLQRAQYTLHTAHCTTHTAECSLPLLFLKPLGSPPEIGVGWNIWPYRGVWFYSLQSCSTVYSLALQFTVWFYSVALEYIVWIYSLLSASTVYSLVVQSTVWFRGCTVCLYSLQSAYMYRLPTTSKEDYSK